MKLPISLSILALGLLAGCGDETLLEKSCGGGTVPNCLPYEYAVITAASVEPGGVTVGDPLETLDVRITFDRCPRLERNHEVAIQLRTGGETPRIFDLVTLRDDGEGGDAMAGDGLVEKTIDNPFIGPEIPSSQDVTLLFRTRAPADCSSGTCVGGTCQSESFELPYTLGARDVME